MKEIRKNLSDNGQGNDKKQNKHKKEKKPTDTRLKTVLYFLKGSKAVFFTAVLFSCFLVFFDLMNPRLIGYFVDICVGDSSAVPGFLTDYIDRMGGASWFFGHLYIPVLIVIGFGLFGAVCRYLNKLFVSKGGEIFVKRIRDLLYDHVLSLPYSWYDSVRTGEIIQRMTSDVETIKTFIADQLTGLIRILVLIGIALVFMFRINVKLAFTASAFIPVILLYSIMFHGRISSSFEKADSEEGRVSAMVQENLTGVRVVRAFGREEYERQRFEKLNGKYTDLWVSVMKTLNIFWCSNDLISGLSNILIMAYGAYLCVNEGLSAGSYIAFISFNSMLIFPVRQLGRMVTELGKAGISIDRIMFILNSPEETDENGALDYPGAGDIVFENVSFAYDTDEYAEDSGETEGVQSIQGSEKQEVIKNLSLTIKKNTTVGILGSTGSGKSTFTALLDNMYEPGEGNGRITYNGIDIKKIKKQELRRHIGIVRQDAFLFSGTIKENLLLGSGASTENTSDKLDKAVYISCLGSALDRFTKGIDTVVGERGVTLSGGQKQRCAIAQMLMRDTDVLVFDDSLSAVDTETDYNIRTRIKEETSDKTVILISHRITTLMDCDEIFVFANGEIKEHGTHEKLLQDKGVYADVYRIQTEGLQTVLQQNADSSEGRAS